MTGVGPVIIDFYLGLGSRYSYLAASQIARIEAEYGCRFVWKPLDSAALIDRAGASPFRDPDPRGQYVEAYRLHDAACWAAYYGVPYRAPEGLPDDPSLLACAALAADAQGACALFCQQLFAAIFADGETVDASVLQRLADEIGLDTAAFATATAAEATRRRHAALVDEAHRRGAFGVPTFFLGNRMFWGNDRLPLLEAALRGKALPPR